LFLNEAAAQWQKRGQRKGARGARSSIQNKGMLQERSRRGGVISKGDQQQVVRIWEGEDWGSLKDSAAANVGPACPPFMRTRTAAVVQAKHCCHGH